MNQAVAPFTHFQPKALGLKGQSPNDVARQTDDKADDCLERAPQAARQSNQEKNQRFKCTPQQGRQPENKAKQHYWRGDDKSR
jgi:hypothetical protein